MKYSDYLLTDHWKELSNKRKSIDGYKCTVCGSTENLNVHHKTYKNIGNEDIDDVITLCHECHVIVHRVTEVFDNNIETNSKGFKLEIEPLHIRKILVVWLWKRNVFDNKGVIEAINRISEIVSYKYNKNIYLYTKNIMEDIVIVKDCVIANDNPTFDKSRRKYKSEKKINYK